MRSVLLTLQDEAHARVTELSMLVADADNDETLFGRLEEAKHFQTMIHQAVAVSDAHLAGVRSDFHAHTEECAHGDAPRVITR